MHEVEPLAGRVTDPDQHADAHDVEEVDQRIAEQKPKPLVLPRRGEGAHGRRIDQHLVEAGALVDECARAGRSVIAIEDAGDHAPWEVDLTGRPLLVAGGELLVRGSVAIAERLGVSPLVIGIVIRVSAPKAAEKLFPVVKKIGGIFLLICLVLTLVLYGREMLGAVGSFAPGAQVLFFVAITAISYSMGFGLNQQQRSAMALGMCTRNIPAVFAAFFGITNPPAGLFVMIVLVVPLAAIVAMVAARLFARQVPADQATDAPRGG